MLSLAFSGVSGIFWDGLDDFFCFWNFLDGFCSFWSFWDLWTVSADNQTTAGVKKQRASPVTRGKSTRMLQKAVSRAGDVTPSK